MNINPKEIAIKDFNYELPLNRIAQFPLNKRDESKLLIYNESNISQSIFKNIAEVIPQNSLLIFNNTKVINARLLFKNKNSKEIEIFCLEPDEGEKELQTAFQKQGSVCWSCMIGNLKSWKDEILSLSFEENGITGNLRAELYKRNPDTFIVKFGWDPPELSFGEVLRAAGIIPLPPYMKRDALAEDKIRYQTVYADTEGSVAAPTAGLHFTGEIIESLRSKNVKTDYITLHVGAGTFKPVKSETISEHIMHSERFFVHRNVIEDILSNGTGKIIAVGTTSLRTIESLYWFGVQLIQNRDSALLNHDILINQWAPYENDTEISVTESFKAVLSYIEKSGEDYISGRTNIIIVPGYRFRVFDGLITNFHQPGSTLLLLIAAFIGKNWREVYEYALNNDFRFLSYGDSSILFR